MAIEPLRTQLLVDGEAVRQEILRSIRGAKRSIRIRMYMWRDDDSGREVLAALQRKIDSDPGILIVIEKDMLGSWLFNIENFITLNRVGGDMFSSRRGLEFIKNARNVRFSYIGSKFFPLYTYIREGNHSKVFLFDEDLKSRHAIIGGMNIADDYLKAQNHEDPDRGGRHDFMVRVEGVLCNPLIPSKATRRPRWFHAKLREGATIISDIKDKSIVRYQIMKELDHAKESVFIEHGYLSHKDIITQLRRLNFSGVKIRIILPDRSDGFWHSNMRSIFELLRPSLITGNPIENIRVFLYRGQVHSKVMVIDEKVSIIGSANLTYGSFDLMRETNAVFHTAGGITKDLLFQLESDLGHCFEVTLRSIPKYSHTRAFLQSIFI